jgi:hypothetical protein
MYQKIKLVIAKIINKMPTKQELDQQLADAIAVAQRVNEENKTLRSSNELLNKEVTQLREDFNSAVERVRYLDGQVRMLELQKQAQKQSDNNRNY